MTAEKRDSAIAYLQSLADEDLAQFFYDALKTRNEYRRHPEGDFWNDVYVIGVVSHMSGEPAEIEVLATALDPTEPGLSEVKALGANQGGRCTGCSTIIGSTSKLAKCPVCGTTVECT